LDPIAVAAVPDDKHIHAEISHLYSVLVWGTIQTEFGTASSGERVNLYSFSLDKRYSAVSDPYGYFYIDDILPARDYSLTVKPRGNFSSYVRGPLDLTSSQTALSIFLEELPVLTLRGEVTNPDGAAVPGFGIRIRSRQKSLWTKNTITDTGGRFLVENVPVGALEFSSTFGPALMITGHELVNDSRTPLLLVVDQGNHELKGLVYDQFHYPVDGARVVLNWENNENGTRSIVDRRTTTGPSGAFSMKDIGSGEHDLVITASDGSTYRRAVDIGNDGIELTVILPKTDLSF